MMVTKRPKRGGPGEGGRQPESSNGFTSSMDATESIDLATLFRKELTESGSFDLRQIKNTAFGKLLLALPIPALLVDKSRSIRFCNEAWGRFTSDVDNLIGVSFESLFPTPDEAQRAGALVGTVFEKRKPIVKKARLIIGLNQIPARIYLRSVRLLTERVIMVLVEDLTLEHQQLVLMKVIERGKKEWEQTVDTMPDRLMIVDEKYQIRRVNKEVVRSLGAAFREAIGQPCYKLLHVLESPPPYCPHVKVLAEGQPHASEYYDEKLGVWFSESASPLRDEKGTIVGSVIVAHDISDRKAAQAILERSHEELERRVQERTVELTALNEKLRAEIHNRIAAQTSLAESEKRFRAILETAPDCIFMKDRRLRYTYGNPSYRELLGLSEADLLKRSDEEIYGAEAGAHIHGVDSRVLEGEVVEEEHVRGVKGAPLVFYDIRTPMRDEQGRIIGICGISRNITDWRERFGADRETAQDYPSSAMRAALASGLLAAQSDVTVLLTGESGAGKDFVAKFIHERSKRAAGPFHALNCASIPRELAESELFGHEAGSFTGAIRRKRGLLELAEGGTLLLNEVAELPLPLQAKLLTFLDTKQFTRVGGEKSIRVDTRIMAATNREIQAELVERRFRRDLFYRLNVFSIVMPPLRERAEDIPLLVRSILSELWSRFQVTGPPGIDPEAVRMLTEYAWPGNVRELRNVLERAVILSRGSRITLGHIGFLRELGMEGPRIRQLPKGKSLDEFLAETERSIVAEALGQTGGNKEKAAQLLGISRWALSRHMKKLELEEA